MTVNAKQISSDLKKRQSDRYVVLVTNSMEKNVSKEEVFREIGIAGNIQLEFLGSILRKVTRRI